MRCSRLLALACALLPISCHESAESTHSPEPATTAVKPAPDVRKGLLVAHALGGIDGLTYTNSIEALRCNHRRGYRWFEVDLTLTQDDELIAFHIGLEGAARLPKLVAELPFSEVERARFREKYAIPRFADVLNEARALGGAVLVTDTKAWTPKMLEAVERAVRAMPGPGEPRLVLQSYGEMDIEAVTGLAKKIGAGVILTLYRTRALDQDVLQMAKQYGVVAVVASQQRFTPWLAERLHASQIPILVHTINEHDEIQQLTRAGADGFYTDTYVPYDLMMDNRGALLDCSAAQPTLEQLGFWLKRDLMQQDDYKLGACAKRGDRRVELTGCDSRAAIMGPLLAVPAGAQVHVELEAEAPGGSTDFWLRIVPKDGSKQKPADKVHLEPGERRALTWDLTLPAGSAALETRLGMSSPEGHLLVHRLVVTLSATPTPTGAAAPPSAPAAPAPTPH